MSQGLEFRSSLGCRGAGVHALKGRFAGLSLRFHVLKYKYIGPKIPNYKETTLRPKYILSYYGIAAPIIYG